MAASDLIPVNKRTKAEQKEITTKGGKASGEARRRNKALKDCLKAILGGRVVDADIKALLAENGLDDNYANAMSLGLISKAMGGDAKAFEVVRDTIGEKPQDKVELSGNLRDDKLDKILEQMSDG